MTTRHGDRLTNLQFVVVVVVAVVDLMIDVYKCEMKVPRSVPTAFASQQ